jgi:hypothetical protein
MHERQVQAAALTFAMGWNIGPLANDGRASARFYLIASDARSLRPPTRHAGVTARH